MSQVLVCAKATAKHPEGRTGTAAGYQAHRYAGEEACEACRSASGKASKAWLEAHPKPPKVQPLPWDGALCAKPTRTYPAGRTGTYTGYLAHITAGQASCGPCADANAARSSDYRATHPEEVKTSKSLYYQKNWHKRREQQLLNKYGLSLHAYAELLEAQGGGCAICGTTDPGSIKNFAVDHDHTCCPGEKTCGKCVRGILCNKCNTGLGAFRDSVELLDKAKEYLS